MHSRGPHGEALATQLGMLRSEIDTVDAALLELLNRRADISQRLGRIKAAAGEGSVFIPQREQEVLSVLAAHNDGPLPEAHLRAIWHEIFASSRALQKEEIQRFQSPVCPAAPEAAQTGELPATARDTASMTSSDQAAPVRIQAPFSKSLSHRYLMAAALAEGTSRIEHVLDSDDLRATRRLLTQLGARLQEMPDASWQVEGTGGQLPRDLPEHPGRTALQDLPGPWATALTESCQGKAPAAIIDCDVQESGTTCRLFTAIAAAGHADFFIHGAERMHQRPLGDLCEALQTLGADIQYLDQPLCPPLLLRARGLDPRLCAGRVALSMEQSSQYFSGLLLAAPLCPAPLRIELCGHKAVSWPYVGLTLQCLEDFGISFCVETRLTTATPWQALPGNSWRGLHHAQPDCLRVTVRPGQYRALQHRVEGDWSGASYFLAAGALGPRAVCVEGLRADSLQGDRAMLDILRQMGARTAVSSGPAGDSITVFPSALHGVELNMGACPDLVPTVAVLAALAQGQTRITQVAHLRIKESNRITAPMQELARLGVTVEELDDGLCVHGCGESLPGRLRALLAEADSAALRFSSHHDHRMAMSLALLECVCPDLQVQARLDEPQVVNKSMPQFWQLWQTLR